jgi:hypothetical protein
MGEMDNTSAMERAVPLARVAVIVADVDEPAKIDALVGFTDSV